MNLLYDGVPIVYGQRLMFVEANHGLFARHAWQRVTPAAYVETLTPALDHADRASPVRSYCAGFLPGSRKSVESMAARVEAGRVQAAHLTLEAAACSAIA